MFTTRYVRYILVRQVAAVASTRAPSLPMVATVVEAANNDVMGRGSSRGVHRSRRNQWSSPSTMQGFTRSDERKPRALARPSDPSIDDKGRFDPLRLPRKQCKDFSLNRPSAVNFSLQLIADHQNRSPTVDFWQNRPVASGPRTGNLVDQYVPPVPDGKYRNCKP
ncbi:hypothetical protein GW17_00024687 [Ensete ventricosum]|nr:hypothetical protein GW17_00024687 [Ensete ventricosum]